MIFRSRKCIPLILDRLDSVERIEFVALFDDARDRPLVVAFFLGLLELIRRAQVRAWQEVAFGPIWLARRTEAAKRFSSLEPAEESVAVDEERLKAVLESLLFAAGEPVSLARLAAVLDPVPKEAIRKALADLQIGFYREGRGVMLDEVAGGFQFRTSKEHALYVRKLLAARPPRLSRPMMETLAIIAYRQPITRPEIEQLRGVDSGAVLETLSERRLIKIAGRKEAPGRPIMYATTAEFLQTFALKDLDSLPGSERTARGRTADRKRRAGADSRAKPPRAPRSNLIWSRPKNRQPEQFDLAASGSSQAVEQEPPEQVPPEAVAEVASQKSDTAASEAQPHQPASSQDHPAQVEVAPPDSEVGEEHPLHHDPQARPERSSNDDETSS